MPPVVNESVWQLKPWRLSLAAIIVLGQLVALGPSAAPAQAQTLPSTSPEAVAARIDALLAADELEQAARSIERNASLLTPARLLLARGDYALATNELAAALVIFKQLVTQPSVAARAQLGIGLAELRSNHAEAALSALEAAVATDPSLARAWTALGVAADRKRDWTRADTAYARALGLEPKSAATLINRGYSMLLRGRFVEAAADSALALTIDPKAITATNNLRLARAMQGDYKTALAGSTKLSMSSDLNTAGFAAMSRGDYGLAETFFTRAMQINPQFDRTAWNNLVYLKQLAHRSDEAGASER